MDTKIAQYAKEHLGITLTDFQLDIIKDVAAGKPIGQLPPRAGLTTANRIMRAYLTDGLTPVSDDAARKYWYKLTPGLIDILLIMLDHVHQKGHNAFTWKEVRDKMQAYQYTQQTKLRFHGLIAKIKDDNGTFTGEWLITRRAADFLRGDIVLPLKVQTQSNKVIDHDDLTVSVRDVYQSDLYLEGREQFIRTPLPSSKAAL